MFLSPVLVNGATVKQKGGILNFLFFFLLSEASLTHRLKNPLMFFTSGFILGPVLQFLLLYFPS